MTDSEKNFLLLQWLKLCIRDESLASRLNAKKYKSVIICGYREYGRLLVEELQAEEIKITCIIEKNYQALQVIEENEILILGFQEEINNIDADVILVTPDMDMQEVRENLEMAGIIIPVISLEQLLLNQI